MRPPEARLIRTPRGVRRLIVDLDPVDLHRYARAVAAVTRPVEGSLAAGVLANRAGPQGHAPPGAGWGRWQRSIATAARRADLVVIRSDVRRCYRNIGTRAVDAGLRRAGVGAADRARVDEILVALRRAGIDGLPVGPGPSAVLANAVLAVADDAIITEGVACLRWVDDVALIGAPRATARAFRAWRAVLAEIGLRVNDDKTSLLRAEGHGVSLVPSLGGRILVP